LVPEFTKFLVDNPIQDPTLDMNDDERSALFGARLVGRWKSGECMESDRGLTYLNMVHAGAPVQVAQLTDDPALADDPQRNNDFIFEVCQSCRIVFLAPV
jgi:hypothetical protein